MQQKNLLKKGSNAVKEIEVRVIRGLQLCKKKVPVQCRLPAPHGSGAVVVKGTSITRDSSEFKWSPPDRDHYTWKILQDGNWEAPSATQTPPATCKGNLATYWSTAKSDPAHTEFLFITSYNPGRPLPPNNLSFLFFSLFFFLIFLLQTEMCCTATDSARDWSRGHRTLPFLPRAGKSSVKTGRWGSITDMITKNNIRSSMPVGMGSDRRQRLLKGSPWAWVRHAAFFKTPESSYHEHFELYPV